MEDEIGRLQDELNEEREQEADEVNDENIHGYHHFYSSLKLFHTHIKKEGGNVEKLD